MKKIVFILLFSLLSACATKPAQYKALEEGKWFGSQDGYKDERLADGTHKISVFYKEGTDRERFFDQRAAEICGGEGKYMVSEKGHRTNSFTSYAFTGTAAIPIQVSSTHFEGIVACNP